MEVRKQFIVISFTFLPIRKQKKSILIVSCKSVRLNRENWDLLFWFFFRDKNLEIMFQKRPQQCLKLCSDFPSYCNKVYEKYDYISLYSVVTLSTIVSLFSCLPIQPVVPLLSLWWMRHSFCLLTKPVCLFYKSTLPTGIVMPNSLTTVTNDRQFEATQMLLSIIWLIADF